MRTKNIFSPIRCDGVSRREFLHVGMLTGIGLGLTDFFRLQAAAPRDKNVRSCILIWLDGGPSHLDTFDPKPNAPSEIRSQFKAISTSVSGIQVCEHLNRTAGVMNEI